jgi:hypothetical protein
MGKHVKRTYLFQSLDGKPNLELHLELLPYLDRSLLNRDSLVHIF